MKPLSKDEELFIKYWEENRLKKKRFFKQLLLSLPLGIAIVSGIFINYFSGWYKRAEMLKNADPSIFITIFIAGIIIIVGIALFTTYFKWDEYEKKYLELLNRKNKNQSNEN